MFSIRFFLFGRAFPRRGSGTDALIAFRARQQRGAFFVIDTVFFFGRAFPKRGSGTGALIAL
jgi:hypothetical protein